MANVCRFPILEEQLDQFGFYTDFLDDQADVAFLDTITDSGSVTVGDAVGGIAALVPSDGTVADNDEAYLATPNEVFKPALGKPMRLLARIQFTEANTDDANIAVGFASAVAANLLVDDGAGLRASGMIIALLKVDGETLWRCVSRNGSAVTNTLTNATAGGASYQRLEIEVFDDGAASTQCTIVYRLNGDILRDSNGKQIQHKMAYASATEQQAFLAVKNGSANLETLNCDVFSAWQKR